MIPKLIKCVEFRQLHEFNQYLTIQEDYFYLHLICYALYRTKYKQTYNKKMVTFETTSTKP